MKNRMAFLVSLLNGSVSLSDVRLAACQEICTGCWNLFVQIATGDVKPT